MIEKEIFDKINSQSKTNDELFLKIKEVEQTLKYIIALDQEKTDLKKKYESDLLRINMKKKDIQLKCKHWVIKTVKDVASGRTDSEYCITCEKEFFNG